MIGATRNNAQVGFQEIGADDRAGLDMVAELHMALLGYGPMAGLGGRFVREICYRAHMKDELLRVVVATVDGRAAGFVAYTPYSASFHRSGLGRHFMRAGMETAGAILSRPARLLKLARALKVLRSRRTENERIDDSMGEVVCVAVRPEYLKASVAKASGVRLSEALISHAADYLRRCGINRMRMLVDADNRPVLMLYHLLGAQFAQYELGGEPVVEVEFDLSDARFGQGPAVPEGWSAAGTRMVAEGSWSAYWESVGERRKLFEAEAFDYVSRLIAALAPGAQSRILDFGCGFGYAARFLAPKVGSVTLWDASVNVRHRAQLRTAHLSNVRYADLTTDVLDPRGEFDLITVHSVIQYMSDAELRAWIARWRQMLASGGRLVLSDLIQPRSSVLRELISYLAFSMANGFLRVALLQGIREIGGYARVRSNKPLLQITPDCLRTLASEVGLKVEILPSNLSYRRSRVSAVLRP